MPPKYGSEDDIHNLSKQIAYFAGDNEESPFLDSSKYSSGSQEAFEAEARPGTSQWLHSIRPSDFIHSRSQYDGHVPPLPVLSEDRVLREFLLRLSSQKEIERKAGPEPTPTPNLIIDGDFVEFELNEFSIFLPETIAHYGGTLTGLQNLATKTGHAEHFFDGVLSFGSQHRYLQKVPFKICSIGNYGQDFDGVGDEIWIQTYIGETYKVFYRLKNPSPEYRRYHRGFLWLANLSKHFVDYASYCFKRKEGVSIHNFRIGFYNWLEKAHAGSKEFRDWLKRFNGKDFRGHISANIEFLLKETSGTHSELLELQIWREVRDLNFIPQQELWEKKTVVTPYVYDCFSHLKFGSNLTKTSSYNNVELRQKNISRSLHLTTNTPSEEGKVSTQSKTEIAVGDVLAVSVDDAKISEWKSENSRWKAADEQWYVLVQKIHFDQTGERSFDIIWLYSPSDTTCALMKYPYNRELFLSDNCSCSRRRIPENDVLHKVSVSWHGSPRESDANFFIRQTYVMGNSFITLRDIHKQCMHIRGDTKTPLQELINAYSVGDTVLFVPPSYLKSKHELEPGEIAGFTRGGEEHVLLRRLIRLQDLDGMENAVVNELVYSDEELSVPVGRVAQKCLVRFYTEEDITNNEIPPPYNRDGTGNAFYISKLLVGQSLRAVHSNIPQSLIQGPDFEARPKSERLRGLDLYCGGGNFGRGLEEGGGIHMTHAVDLDRNAIHTYFANLENPELTKLYFGSVNDLLAEALRGNPSRSTVVPLPGDIDFISSGSPCPGFSSLTCNKDGAKGLRDQSLVASVAAFIDVYRPKYALMENVITMAKKGGKRDEDVLSQLICCVVGMGYQVQVFNLDAWSFGSPQSRSRLFVSIAAPGLEPPAPPALSHSHANDIRSRGLGKMANGESFGERRFEKTPFKYITAGEATKDVPDIGDGRTFHCTWHPDHRMSRGIPRLLKAQIESIPLSPRGMNYAMSVQGMLPSERSLFPTLTRDGLQKHNTKPNSKAFERINPQKVFPTVTTSVSPWCARTGKALHWNQQRLLTILEVRRAQSFPDEEVLIGSTAAQWKIVGNSVARTASLALGLSIHEAWVKSFKHKPQWGIRNNISITKTSSLEEYYHSSIENQILESPVNRNRTITPGSVRAKKRQRKGSTGESPSSDQIDKRRLFRRTSQDLSTLKILSHDRPASPTLGINTVKENCDRQLRQGLFTSKESSDNKLALTNPSELKVTRDHVEPLESDFTINQGSQAKPASPRGFWDAFQSSAHLNQSAQVIRKDQDIVPPERDTVKVTVSTLILEESRQRRHTILAPTRVPIQRLPPPLPKLSEQVIGLIEDGDDLIIVSPVQSQNRVFEREEDGKTSRSSKTSIAHRPSLNGRTKLYTTINKAVLKATIT